MPMQADRGPIIPPTDISDVQDELTPGEKVPLAGLRATSAHPAFNRMLGRCLRVGSWSVIGVQACLEVLTIVYPSALVAIPVWVREFPFALAGISLMGVFALYWWLAVNRKSGLGFADVDCPRCGWTAWTDDLGLKDLRRCPKCQSQLVVHWSQPFSKTP